MHPHLFQFEKCSPTLRRLPLVLCLAALFCLAGCSGKKGSKAKVSGKVTLNGKDVAGDIFFVSEDGKEYLSPITKGAYLVTTAPPGKYKVLVKSGLGLTGASMPKQNTPAAGNLAGKDMADMPTKKEAAGVAPPMKYAKADTSDLTYDVKDGDQTKDFELAAK